MGKKIPTKKLEYVERQETKGKMIDLRGEKLIRGISINSTSIVNRPYYSRKIIRPVVAPLCCIFNRINN
jgi:hypothetical protein